MAKDWIDKALARMMRARKIAVRAATPKKRRRKRKAVAKPTTLRVGVPALRLPVAGWKVAIARMELDTWYSSGEIVKLLPEYAATSIPVWLINEARDCVERGENPDWAPGLERLWGKAIPRYLFRVAPSVAGKRSEWRRAIGLRD